MEIYQQLSLTIVYQVLNGYIEAGSLLGILINFFSLLNRLI